ncbi:hypothetical protein HDV05_006794 [Chytridiales sp. JEL 0842]|nr:hypothetical protein HDV05_006794 [Chytridiales sp. JEL 0842]
MPPPSKRNHSNDTHRHAQKPPIIPVSRTKGVKSSSKPPASSKSHSPQIPTKKAEKLSSRLQAAKVALIAIEFSLSIESDDSDLQYESEYLSESDTTNIEHQHAALRLICLELFTLLCMKIDSAQLSDLLLCGNKASDSKALRLILRVVSSLLPMRLTCPAGVEVQQNKYRQQDLKDLHSQAETKSQKNAKELDGVARVILYGIAKYLSKAIGKVENDDMLQVLILMHEDNCKALKDAFVLNQSKLISHQNADQNNAYDDLEGDNTQLIIHVKELIMPLLGLGLWNRNRRKPINELLKNASAAFRAMTHSSPDTDTPIDIFSKMASFSSIVVDILNGFQTVPQRSRLQSRWLRNSVSSPSIMPLVIREETAAKLVDWALSLASEQQIIIQRFMLPVLSQLATNAENWLALSDIITAIYNGRLRTTKEPTNIMTTLRLLTLWLITIARSSRPESSLSHLKDIPNAISVTNLRVFCIRMLGILTNYNREISLCLLYLFDDECEPIRTEAVTSIAMRSLNHDLAHFVANTSPSAYLHFHHKACGECIFDMSANSLAVEDILFSKTYKTFPMKSPYKLLLKCVDELLMSMRSSKMTTESTRRRISCLESWAETLTEHIFGTCSLLSILSQAKADLTKSTNDRIPQHLQAFSDFRLKSLDRFISELTNRVGLTKPETKSHDIDASDVRFVPLRQMVLQIFSGIMTGVLRCAESKAEPNANAYELPGRIFGRIAPALYSYRHDSSVDTRAQVLKLLRNTLNYRISENSLYHAPLKKPESDFLVMVYKLAIGKPPMPELGGQFKERVESLVPSCFNDSPLKNAKLAEENPAIKTLVCEIMDFGRRYHSPIISIAEIGTNSNSQKVDLKNGAPSHNLRPDEEPLNRNLSLDSLQTAIDSEGAISIDSHEINITTRRRTANTMSSNYKQNRYRRSFEHDDMSDTSTGRKNFNSAEPDESIPKPANSKYEPPPRKYSPELPSVTANELETSKPSLFKSQRTTEEISKPSTEVAETSKLSFVGPTNIIPSTRPIVGDHPACKEADNRPEGTALVDTKWSTAAIDVAQKHDEDHVDRLLEVPFIEIDGSLELELKDIRNLFRETETYFEDALKATDMHIPTAITSCSSSAGNVSELEFKGSPLKNPIVNYKDSEIPTSVKTSDSWRNGSDRESQFTVSSMSSPHIPLGNSTNVKATSKLLEQQNFSVPGPSIYSTAPNQGQESESMDMAANQSIWRPVDIGLSKSLIDIIVGTPEPQSPMSSSSSVLDQLETLSIGNESNTNDAEPLTTFIRKEASFQKEQSSSVNSKFGRQSANAIQKSAIPPAPNVLKPPAIDDANAAAGTTKLPNVWVTPDHSETNLAKSGARVELALARDKPLEVLKDHQITEQSLPTTSNPRSDEQHGRSGMTSAKSMSSSLLKEPESLPDYQNNQSWTNAMKDLDAIEIEGNSSLSLSLDDAMKDLDASQIGNNSSLSISLNEVMNNFDTSQLDNATSLSVAWKEAIKDEATPRLHNDPDLSIPWSDDGLQHPSLAEALAKLSNESLDQTNLVVDAAPVVKTGDAKIVKDPTIQEDLPPVPATGESILTRDQERLLRRYREMELQGQLYNIDPPAHEGVTGQLSQMEIPTVASFSDQNLEASLSISFDDGQMDDGGGTFDYPDTTKSSQPKFEEDYSRVEDKLVENAVHSAEISLDSLPSDLIKTQNPLLLEDEVSELDMAFSEEGNAPPPPPTPPHVSPPSSNHFKEDVAAQKQDIVIQATADLGADIEHPDKAMSMAEFGQDRKVDLDAFLTGNIISKSPVVKSIGKSLHLDKQSGCGRNDTSFSEESFLKTPTRAKNVTSRAPYTGASVLEDTADLSIIPTTAGSPQSFEWTSEDIGGPKLVAHADSMVQTEGILDGMSKWNSDHHINEDNDRVDAVSKPGLTSNLSLTNISMTSFPSMVRPRLRAALDLVLRHLIFSPEQKPADEGEELLNYVELYCDGLDYANISHLAALPVAGYKATASPNKRNTLHNTLLRSNEGKVNEALHPILRNVFRLDMSLFVDMLSSINMGVYPAMAVGDSSNLTLSEKLLCWIIGLAEVHEHLLPASRALFKLQRQLPSPITLAQAMIIVKDQVTLSRITTLGNAAASNNPFLSQQDLGNPSMLSVAQQSSRSQNRVGFLSWVACAMKK